MTHYSLYFIYYYLILFSLICSADGTKCKQEKNCVSPKCYCSEKYFPKLEVEDIPQMVYFGFDDAVNILNVHYYDDIFHEKHYNPNGCPIKMSLYVSHKYTNYDSVNKFYKDGHEIGVHSVNHVITNTSELLLNEAKQQKQNLMTFAGVQEQDIVGWRSPLLVPAGNEQPKILKDLGFKYDITLTYTQRYPHPDIIWPSTLDFAWPYNCNIPKCPTTTQESFWEVPVIPLYDKYNRYKCTYVDGCVYPPLNETETIDYLWNNFNINYKSSRAPFGLNMHASWFSTSNYNRALAVNKFLNKILALGNVYVVSVKEVLEWMENPTKLSNLSNFKPWSCPTFKEKKSKT